MKPTLILVLLVLCASVTGCVWADKNATAIQQIGANNKADGKQQDKSQTSAEELRLAQERARIAEEKADIERQKAEIEKQRRELAEERLRFEQESAQESTPSGQQSHHYTPPPPPEYKWFKWCSDEPVPRVGETVYDDDGNPYKIVEVDGIRLKTIAVD